MNRRFSDRAKQALALAQEEAQALGQDNAEPEHVLLGLIRQGDGIAFNAIQSFGITLEPARRLVAELTDQTQDVMGPIRFSPPAEKALETAQRQAFRTGQRTIDTEHILLSLLDDEDGPVAYVLTQLGQPPSRIRMRVVRLLATSQVDAESIASHPLFRHRLGGEERRLLSDVLEWAQALEVPLKVLDQRLRLSRELDDLDDQIEHVRRLKAAAVGAAEHDKVAALRKSESELLGSKAAREAEWAAEHPDISPTQADAIHRLSAELALLRCAPP